MADVLWLCATGDHPVGIVKLYDEIEQRWKYYIGTGDGKDPDADVQMILAKGQKSYSLDHIMDFWEEDVVKVVRCKDCQYHNELLSCEMVEWAQPDESFCCYGKRKEES